MAQENLIGTKFHSLTVTKQLPSYNNRRVWLCKCDCGNDKEMITSELKRGRINSCGKCKFNLLNKKFGKLLVIEKLGSRSDVKSNYIYWKCRCECGNITYVPTSKLNNGHTQSCGCLSRRQNKQNPGWKGYEEISAHYYRDIVASALRRNIDMDITIEDAWNQFLLQDRKCAYSKIELVFAKYNKDYSATASLDRIDSSKGYTKSNIQWVHKDVNKMKMNLSEKRFLLLCKEIVKNL